MLYYTVVCFVAKTVLLRADCAWFRLACRGCCCLLILVSVRCESGTGHPRGWWRLLTMISRGRRGAGVTSSSLSSLSQPATTATMYGSSLSLLMSSWPSRDCVTADQSLLTSPVTSPYVSVVGAAPRWKYLHVKSVPNNVSYMHIRLHCQFVSLLHARRIGDTCIHILLGWISYPEFAALLCGCFDRPQYALLLMTVCLSVCSSCPVRASNKKGIEWQ